MKSKRPFIGIVLKVHKLNYFAPLSSPKEKHKKMKNTIDFIKINDGRDGVINLNNMMPIPENELYEINIKEEIRKDKKYGLILKYQLLWCNKNKESINKNAEKLYYLITNNKANLKLKKRCCDFKQLEKSLEQFNSNLSESEEKFLIKF